MKKFSLFILILFVSSCFMQAQAANKAYNSTIRNAINKYKAQNYVGCIQDLEYVTKKDPSNTVAYYYLGSAYMRVGNKDKATSAFDKVVNLNTAPMLTSYSIQAQNCMDNLGMCEYRKLTPDQVTELMKDPKNYLTELKQKEKAQLGENEYGEKAEIEKLINGRYPENIHPDAKKVIIETELIKERQNINGLSNTKLKTEAPTNDEIATAVKTLAKIGFNPFQGNASYAPNNEYASLNMMLGNGNNNQSNNYMNMLPFIMSQSQSGNKQMSADMIQAMMMSSMMPDFNSDSSRNY